MKNIFLAILILIIFLSLVKDKMIKYDYIDNFLEINKYDELKEYKNIFFKKLKENKNLLAPLGFKNTKNITYYFNLDYLYKMREKDILFNIISNIIDKSPKEGNYIVANFLEIDPSIKEYSPELHQDTTVCKFLNCEEERDIYPEVVGVLYLIVPKCIKGGELVVVGNYNQSIKYIPKNNRVVYFHGEYKHGVKGYSMNKCKSDKRLSLVVEIYDVNGYHLSLLPKIHVDA
jgi:hypothetical protein